MKTDDRKSPLVLPRRDFSRMAKAAEGSKMGFCKATYKNPLNCITPGGIEAIADRLRFKGDHGAIYIPLKGGSWIDEGVEHDQYRSFDFEVCFTGPTLAKVIVWKGSPLRFQAVGLRTLDPKLEDVPPRLYFCPVSAATALFYDLCAAAGLCDNLSEDTMLEKVPDGSPPTAKGNNRA